MEQEKSQRQIQKEILQAARKLIEESKHWTQGKMARDAYGNPIDRRSPLAVCFCAWGAVGRVCAGLGYDRKQERDMIMPLMRFFPGDFVLTGLVEFNDTHTHGEVIELFDKTIASLEVAA